MATGLGDRIADHGPGDPLISPPLPRRSPRLRLTARRPLSPTAAAGVALGGLAVAMLVRSLVGGRLQAFSLSAALAFSAVLLATAVAAGWSFSPLPRPLPLLWGAAGGGSLLILAATTAGPLRLLAAPPGGRLAWWAPAVVAVAIAEEVVLRGLLYESVGRVAGPLAAVAAGAVAFGLLHVPLYGWRALPLDVAVGLLLGGLRMTSGSVAAPATAHVIADLAGAFMF